MTKPTGRTRSSRDALLAAALTEFTERGYEAATVTDVAERAGVTTGALYAHFGGKLDLLVQALGLAPASELFRELSDVAGRSWPRASQLLGRNLALEPDPATLLLLDAIVAGRRDERVRDALRDGLQAYEDAIVQATEAGRRLGLVDPALGAEDLARVLTLLLLGRMVVAAVGTAPPAPAGYRQLVGLLLQEPPDGPDGAAEQPAEPVAALDAVRAGAAAVERSRDDLAGSIAAAVDAGHSLRQVGEAAGMSHERVRQLLRHR